MPGCLIIRLGIVIFAIPATLTDTMMKTICTLGLSLIISTAITLGTVYGASALYNDPEAIFLSQSGACPSLDGPIKAALAGDTLTLDQVYTYHKLQPSTKLISKAVIADLIHQGHVKAKALAKRGQVSEAVNVLYQSLNLSHYMSCLISKKVAWFHSIPRCWLESWSDSAVGLQLSDYIAPLNDYGFFLQQAGKDAEAITIFKAVIGADPTREVAYLNLADSLKKTGNVVDSGQYYGIYKQLMQHENKTGLIPNRVDSGRKQAITTDADINTEVVEYMDIVRDTIRKAWHPAKSETPSKVVAQFHVDRTGHLQDLKVVTTSGDKSRDQSAIDTLTGVVLPPPPKSIKPDDDIRFSFDYNVFNTGPSKVYPIDRWMADVKAAPATANVLPLVEALMLLHRFDDAEAEVDAALKRDPRSDALAVLHAKIENARAEDHMNETANSTSIRKVLTQSALKLAGGAAPGPRSPRENRANAEGYPEHRKDHAGGLIAIHNGAWDLAIIELSRAALSFPSCTDSFESLAMAYNSRSFASDEGIEKTMHDLHCSYCIDPNSQAVENNIAARMSKKMSIDPSTFNGHADYADTLSKSGDLIGAVVEYHMALKIHPDAATLGKLAQLAAKLKLGAEH